MDNTVDFNRFTADDIECKVGFDDKNTIACILELFVAGHAAEKRVGLKAAEALVDFINKDRGIRRTVICDPVKDGDKVVNSDGKITEQVLICHANAV